MIDLQFLPKKAILDFDKKQIPRVIRADFN